MILDFFQLFNQPMARASSLNFVATYSDSVFVSINTGISLTPPCGILMRSDVSSNFSPHSFSHAGSISPLKIVECNSVTV